MVSGACTFLAGPQMGLYIDYLGLSSYNNDSYLFLSRFLVFEKLHGRGRVEEGGHEEEGKVLKVLLCWATRVES